MADSILTALSPNIYAETFSNANRTIFDEVVVSATRTDQNIKDVSISISKVTAADIEQTMPTDIQDALKYTRGVSANGAGRFAQDQAFLAAVVELHDLNLAAQYSDRVIVLKDGKLQVDGTPWEAITIDIIKDVYGHKTMIQAHPMYKFPVVYAA